MKKIPAFWQAVIVIVVAYIIFDNAFPPVLPQTLLIQYMIITIIGVLLYFSFDDEKFAEFMAPINAVLRAESGRNKMVQWGFLIAIPAIVGFTVYGSVKPSFESPIELRQVHPAPPTTLKVYNKTFDLTKLENPVREDVIKTMATDEDAAWKKYDSSVDAGRKVFYQNCFYCHGDLMFGQGLYGKGFNPMPINFQDVGMIAQLQEAFVFWRITTGGPGLPKEGTPWNSAMPVWHEIISEAEVWDVMMFIYDYVGQVPRIWDTKVSAVVTGMKEKVKTRRDNLMGKELYLDRCAHCHGDNGAGDGVAANRMYPKPRDFTTGLFKYKTSPGKKLPRDEDIFNTIKHGLNGTGMPAWEPLLSDAQINSMIPLIKSFDTFGAWAPEDAPDEAFDMDTGAFTGEPIKVTEALEVKGKVNFSEDSLAKGKPIFEKVCAKCHGLEGRGNITSGKKLMDDWNNRIWPRDLTKPYAWRATEVAGDTPEAKDATIANIFTRLSVGIPGTPMPEHATTMSSEDRWHVSNYAYSLRESSVQLTSKSLIRGIKVEGDLPTDINDAAWQGVDATTLMMVPNLIKEGRLFTPLNDAVTVQALYNKDEIAFLLTVDDRTDSRPGEKVSEGIQDAKLKMHPDAFAIQFPKLESYNSKGIVTKPLFRHGDGKNPTTIWYWNAGAVEPARPAMSVLLDATGPNEKLKHREGGDLVADGAWKKGQWKVIMKRSRTGGDSGDLNFTEGEYIPVSFANWDGSNGEAGSKHTLTSWYWLLLPPKDDPVRTFGIPAGIAFITFALGLVLVRSQRGKQG